MAVTLPTIQRLERSDTEGVINAIIRDGCCVVKGFADADTISTVNREVQPYLEADKPWKVRGPPVLSPVAPILGASFFFYTSIILRTPLA
jgi:hypothetical protein